MDEAGRVAGRAANQSIWSVSRGQACHLTSPPLGWPEHVISVFGRKQIESICELCEPGHLNSSVGL